MYEGVVDTGEKDYSALVSKIKSSGADLVYWGGLHTEGGLIIRQMRDQGVKAPLMGGDGITTDELASIAGPGVEGTLMTYGPDARGQPGREGRGGEIPRRQVRAGSLHALQLCDRSDHQAGCGIGQVRRPEKGRREDALRHDVQDRARRHLLRQEGRPHEPRLRDVHLEERRRRQDHLRRMPRQRLHEGEVSFVSATVYTRRSPPRWRAFLFVFRCL